MSAQERGVVKFVTLDVEYPNGATKKVVVDVAATGVEAIVWSDQAVQRILAPYYDSDEVRQRSPHSSASIKKMWEPDVEGWEDRPTVLLKGALTWTIPTCCLRADCGNHLTQELEAANKLYAGENKSIIMGPEMGP